MSNEFCPHGHELNADGTCSRDGYVKPVEVATEPEATEELGNDQVDGNTPDSPSTGSNETSGSPTDTPVDMTNVEMQDHVITEEDLVANPDLVTEGVKVGDVIQLPVVPREDVVAALGEEKVAEIEAQA